MVNSRGLIVVGAFLSVAACTATDSLLEPGGKGGGMGSGTGGESIPGGAGAETGGGTSGGRSSGGVSAAGNRATGGAGDGGSPGGPAAGASGAGDNGAGDDGGGSSSGGRGEGGSAGNLGGAGGTGGAEACPKGQMWCPGCTVGSGQCAVGCPGAACGPCSEVATEEECDARIDCHSVYRDPGTCGCAGVGCCAMFEVCADGERADCEGKAASCDAPTPFCDDPAYVVSFSGFCYEGCVKPGDCAPDSSSCTAPDDPSGCACYTDADCAADERCYSADCENQRPGTCRRPPPAGCFGDADCAPGELCLGGSPAPCNTTIADGIGTCGTVECADGYCGGRASAPECTCLFEDQCVPATGPLGSARCRAEDGTCFDCECAAPDTPIATPSGERAIAELRSGDLVYSVDGAQIRAVPIVRVNRTPVANHRVLRIDFDNRRSIEMSAGHPLADGHPLSSLRVGSELLGARVVAVETVPYRYPATYDILPDSTSAAYFASGVLIGSTLSREPQRGLHSSAHTGQR